MARLLFVFSVLTALLGSSHVLAWGGPGHALIAELAERQLSPHSREEIRRLLANEAIPNLAAVASWPDEIRGDEVWRWTAPMHYVAFADASCTAVLANKCTDGLCVTEAIKRYQRELADTSLSNVQRARALAFLVHFVGDVHQPLHASYRPDKGGNNFQISIDGAGTNLHAVWDGLVLGIERRDVAAKAKQLQSFQSARQAFVPDQWGRESCLLIDSLNLYPARPGRLPKGYLSRMRPHAEAQIALSAARLAVAIELALKERAPATTVGRADMAR